MSLHVKVSVTSIVMQCWHKLKLNDFVTNVLLSNLKTEFPAKNTPTNTAETTFTSVSRHGYFVCFCCADVVELFVVVVF